MKDFNQNVFRLEAIENYTSPTRKILMPKFDLPKRIFLIWLFLIFLTTAAVVVSFLPISIKEKSWLYISKAENPESDSKEYMILIDKKNLKYLDKNEIKVGSDQDQEFLNCQVLSIEDPDKLISGKKIEPETILLKADCRNKNLGLIESEDFPDKDAKIVYLELGKIQLFSFFSFNNSLRNNEQLWGK